jgi:GGDEF domain-containing protein
VSDDFLDPRLAERLTRAARAAQTLSETLWEALHEELAAPRSERVAELSGRLADLSTIVASLARVDTRPPSSAEPLPAGDGGRAPDVASEPTVAPAESGSRGERATHDRRPIEESLPSPEPTATQAPLSMAVLVDELAPEEPSRIEVRDVRGEDGPVAWVGAIGRRLERYEQDSSPFAVLLVELVESERLRRAESSDEVSRLTSQVEDALARTLRPADSLTRESPGRYWLLAPQTGESGARMLAEQLARAVRSSASHRGAPVEVAVGIAVCPEDGRAASELAAHADVGLYAARAAGRSSTDG